MGLVLAVVLIGALAASITSILPLTAGLGLLAVLVWFALPGIILALRLYSPPDRRASAWIGALLAGSGWGYVLSSTALLALWVGGLRSFAVLMIAPILALMLIWPARR